MNIVLDDEKQAVTIEITAYNGEYYSFDITVCDHTGSPKLFSVVAISSGFASNTDICDSLKEYIQRFEIPLKVYGYSTLTLQPLFGTQIMLMMRSNNMRYQYVPHPSKKGDGEKSEKSS